MKLIFTKAVIKDVKNIKNENLKSKIRLLISELKSFNSLNEIKSTKKMKGHSYAYRIRIGNYRLGFYYKDNTIFLARFLKRSDIYSVFP